MDVRISVYEGDCKSLPLAPRSNVLANRWICKTAKISSFLSFSLFLILPPRINFVFPIKDIVSSFRDDRSKAKKANFRILISILTNSRIGNSNVILIAYVRNEKSYAISTTTRLPILHNILRNLRSCDEEINCTISDREIAWSQGDSLDRTRLRKEFPRENLLTNDRYSRQVKSLPNGRVWSVVKYFLWKINECNWFS